MSTCAETLNTASRLSTGLPDGFVKNWEFVPSSPRLVDTVRRVRGFALRRQTFPRNQVLLPLVPSQRWSLYFLFVPDGTLATVHRFTLAALKRLDRRLLVIAAAPDSASIAAELYSLTDALVWKAMPGFDFSAYSIGLRLIADCSPGADVLVMNDSVYGPFGDIEDWVERAQWQLTGFTASDDFENHIQSYAFHLRGVDHSLLRALRTVFSPSWCFDEFWEVVRNQETRFARVAARRVTVGSMLFGHVDQTGDPMLQSGLALFAGGVPFLKRSLTGKFAAKYDQDVVQRALALRGYPIDG